MTYWEHGLRALGVLKQGYSNGLTADDAHAEPPEGTLKVQLRSHQKTVLAAMEAREKQFSRGATVGSDILYSNYSILGDSVGVGKSLMILGHIARVMRGAIPPIEQTSQVDKSSSTGFFSIKQTMYTDISEAGCLIVIPHTLYRQWADYVKKQTTLKAVFLDKMRAVVDDTPEFLKTVLEADLVLVSNTMYKSFGYWQKEKGLKWRRFFLDEADTIHITSGSPVPEARFTWLVSASWTNLLFPNSSIYLPQHILSTHVFDVSGAFYELRTQLQGSLTSHYGNHMNYLRYVVRSSGFLRYILNETHPLRGNLIVRCSDQYIKDSISLPPLVRQTILCKPTMTHRLVGDIVPSDVQHLLHAGDVHGAIEALGVKADDTTTIVEAVTKNLQKELARLQATRTFKDGLDYSTPRAKEEALKSLDDKIAKVKDNIKSLEERIKNFKQDSCPICYDDPQEPLLTPCCNHVFCGQCLLTSMTRSTDCPMCRTPLHPSKLVRVMSDEEKNAIVPSGASASADAEPVDEPKKKSEALLDLFTANPDGRFLLFSRYDNPFTAIESSVAALGIHVKQLKGNKDQIASTLRQFQSGEIKCLLLNASYAGAGLNITAATHVILLHAMTLEEEKQILGRAYRMGRSGTLTYIKLLHPDEMPPE